MSRRPVIQMVTRVAPAQSGGFTTEAIDGTTAYFSGFTNSLPDTATYFPLAVWGSYEFSDTTYGDGHTGTQHIATDQDVGINTYVWSADASSQAMTNIRSAGMYLLQSIDEDATFIGTETRGYVVIDEADMSLLSGSDPWTGTVAWNTCVPIQDSGGRCGYTACTTQSALVPSGHLKYINWGKGVLNGDNCPDTDAEHFVNTWGDLTNGDFYWFTDPWGFTGSTVDMLGPSYFPASEVGTTLTLGKLRRAANYGYAVDRMRELDGRDGSSAAARKPVWVTIELGNPWYDDQGSTSAGVHRSITANELRAGVWHGLIARARGVLYFNHNFGSSPTVTSHIIRDPTNFGTIITAATSLNTEITSLASVLNAPTVTDRFTDGTNIRSLVKRYNGQHYVFSASTKDGGSGSYSATWAITGAGAQSVPVINESRTVSMNSSGQVTDTFASDLAVHLYGPITVS